LPGTSIIEALKKATQPDLTGKLHSFSCYRATEYVIVLGIAQELACVNPDLLGQLQRQWELRAIKSARFHEVFLDEYGSMDDPLPLHYYVPGDRVWFRNPDARSADIAGYEGSWVIYLGGGLFSNFWKRHEPYTLTTKCVEIYHWRDGAYVDAEGELQMNEQIVGEQILRTLDDPDTTAKVLQKMMRLRDRPGVFADGGCLDASREFPRRICPGTANICFPDAPC
jgi:hypothetical protein